jgi:hypothetical protein
MRIFRSIMRDYPAFVRTITVLLGINLVLWIGLRIFFHDGRPSLFLLGDSCIGNYRMAPGERMQDMLQKMVPGMQVENWAEPGSSPLDFLLQISKGSLICPPPSCVVIAMAPDKLLGVGRAHRMDEDGADLRWIPLDRTGVRIWSTLTPRERSVAVVQKASLFLYGFSDAIRAAWIRYWKWPHERRDMCHASPKRREKIEKHARELGKSLDTAKIGSDADYAALVKSQDAKLLLDILREKGIATLVIVHPYGDPALLQRNFSPLALAKRDTINQRMHNWLVAQRVPFIDCNAPKRLSNFPDSVWDDNAHLKAPQAFHYLSEQTYLWLASSSPKIRRPRQAGTHPSIPVPSTAH